MQKSISQLQTSLVVTAPEDSSRVSATILMASAALYLFLNLFASPSTPYLLGGDQTFFWLGGQRMLSGDRVYIDFLRFTPPGADVFFYGLFKVFGPHVWATNLAVLVIGLIFTWKCYTIAAKLMIPRMAALAAAMFLVVLYGKSLSITHHWFSGLAIAFAVDTLLTAVTSATIVRAAAFLALAAFFNQAHGATALVAITLYLLIRSMRGPTTRRVPFRDLVLLIAVFAVTFIALETPFLIQSGPQRLWYFQVTYVIRYASRLTQGSALGLPGELNRHALPKLSQYLAIYIALPIAYVWSLLRCWRERDNPDFLFDRVLLVSLTGTLLYVEVARNINWVRLYAIGFPGILLFAWILTQSRPSRRAITLLWLIVAVLGLHQTHANRATHSVRAVLPGGRLATTPESYRKLEAVSQRTHPGDLFFQAGWPGMYLPLQLRDPLFLSTVSYLEAARPEDIGDTVHQLESTRVPLILWTASLDLRCPPGQRCEDYLSPLRDYLASHYTPLESFPDGDTLWQLNR